MQRLKTILQSTNILLIILIIVIICSYILSLMDYKSKYNINDNIIEGKLLEYKIDGDKFSFIINGREKVKCIYYIKTIEEKNYLSNLDLGIILKINGELSIPSNNTIPNTFNYKNYLKHKNIYYVMNVNNYKVINNNTNIFYILKNMLIKYINNFKTKDYLNMFIIGNKSMLDDNLYESLQDAGVIHVFSISGMHISILSLIIYKILNKLHVKDNISYICIIISLLFYLFITNYASSILRSVTLYICLYFNKKYDFYLDTIKIFYITIIILLLINFNLLFDIGFLYSSIISYALIRYSKLIKGNYIMKSIKISLIALLFSLPITINTNYEINILSIFNNILIVPLISFIYYPLSLLVLIIKPLDSIYLILINILNYICKYLLVYKIIIPKLNIIYIIIYYILVYIFFNTYNKKILLIILLSLVGIKYSYLIDNNYYFYYLDVKQGDSSLIIHKGNVIMIDTGGKTSYVSDEWKKKKEYYYTDNTIKLLKSMGISKINYLILTHGDYDHMGESIHLIDNFKVNKVILNKDSYNDLEASLINKLNNKHIKYYNNINKINYENINIYFLDTNLYDNENDNSNVLYFKLFNYKFMYMGDAGVSREKDILNKYNISNIDFYKVGHHGSDTSSSECFINKMKPKYSIISVGKNNRYGHPKDSALDILKNSKILRTDQDGSIMVKINNNKLKVETYIP